MTLQFLYQQGLGVNNVIAKGSANANRESLVINVIDAKRIIMISVLMDVNLVGVASLEVCIINLIAILLVEFAFVRKMSKGKDAENANQDFLI